MIPIRIIDRDFNLLGEIDDYITLILTRRYSKVGEFEIHLPLAANNSDKLLKGNVIMLGNNIKKTGMVMHKEIKESTEGEYLLIKGFTLETFLSTRITIPPSGEAYDSINSCSESVLKHYVIMNCITPEDDKRIIPRLIVCEDKGRGITTSYQSRLKPLDEEMQSISEYSGLGFEIVLDLDKSCFVFDIIEGEDKSVSQDILPPVVFSVEFDNVINQEYVDSNIGYKNIGYIGGQGEGADRNIIIVGGEISGFDRVEAFIDARDINEDDDLEERGYQKLQEFQETKTFTSEIVNSTFIYEKDWYLGDIVTLVNKRWNITMDSRITEVIETYEESGLKIEATFGNSIPTLIDKVKTAIDNPVIETPTETKYDDRYYTKTEVDAKLENATAPTYIFTQISPSTVWHITHNLEKYPSITVIDSGGNEVYGDKLYIDNNNLKITFTAAFSGVAYLN